MSSDNEIGLKFNGNSFNVKKVERGDKVLLYDGKYMIYEGNLNENDKFNGYGILYYTPKIIEKFKKGVIGKIKYEGEFKNGFYNGEGKSYYENGNIKLRGEFNNGVFIRGIEYYTNGKINVDSRINCKIENSKYTGYIKKYNNDGTIIYEGDVVDHMYDGYGILYYPSGNLQYIGEWLNHAYHGYGTFYDDASNGIIYKGEFKNCMEHGKGIGYTQDGTIYNGYFANDKFVEEIEEDIEKEIDSMIQQIKPTFDPNPTNNPTDKQKVDLTIDPIDDTIIDRKDASTTKSIIESKLDDYLPSYDECEIKYY